MEITTAEALLSLTPTAKWVISNGTTTWQDAIAAIKLANPKP